MRGRRQNGKQSGSALQQQGKSRHQQRGLGARHLLRLLVLLAAQQGFSLVDGKSLSRSILQPAAVVVGTFLASQPVQAQQAPTLTATAGDGQVTLNWTDPSLSQGRTLNSWRLLYKKSSVSGWPSSQATQVTLAAASRSTVVSGLINGEEYTFRLAFRFDLSGVTYTDTNPSEVTATPTPTPGVTISKETLTVDAGASDTYTVVLDSDPGAQVVVTPTSGDTTKATVSGALTFTTATNNWSTAQTVTVTGVAAGPATISHTITGYTGVQNSDIDTVDVTVNNKTITLSADSTTIEEGDSGRKDVTITLRLGEAASGNDFAISFSLDAASTGKATTLPLSSKCANPVPADADMCWSQYVGHGSAGSFNASRLELSSGATTGTIKIGILGDTTDENDETLVLKATKSGWTAGTLTLTIKDDDGPGVTISEDTLTMDKGDSATYTVVLDTDPGAQVVVTPTPTAKATVSPAKLTFTTATNNWSTAQTVTVTGAAAGTATISHTITGYSGVSGSDIDTVDVTVEETIAAPVLTTATSTTSGRINLTWTHAGSAIGDLVSGAANFSVWQAQTRIKGGSWSNEPVLPSSSRTNIATRSARVQPGDDYPDGAVVQVRIRARGYVTGTSGTQANGPWSDAREVTYKNDNLAALTITGEPVTVTEASSTTYTVALTKAYGGVLSISSDDTGIATVEPSTLTFAAATYNTAQTVTVTGVANGSADINHAFRLTGATAEAIPDAGSVDVTVKAPPSVTVDPTTLSVNEGGSGAYTVKLDTEPTADVTITVAGESGDVSVTGSPLTFTTQNYNTAQTVTVNAAEDDDAVTDTAVTLTHSASGGGYNSVTIDSVQVTVTDTTPTLQLSTNPSAVTEGAAISLTVTSDRTLIGPLPVSLTLAARSSSGFTAADIPGTLGPRTFNANFGSSPGGTTGTVSIPTSRDTDATEGAEAYRITLNDAAGYAVGTDVRADGTLNDAAAAISLSVADASAAEGDGAMSFTVTASSAPSTAVTFKYTVTAESGDTATAGTDFTAVTAAAKGSGAIAANAQTTTISVTLADDNDDESDETFTVTLSEPSGATISDAVATGTITDDDNTPPPTGGGGSGGSGSGGGGSTPSPVPAAPTGVGGSAASTSAGNGQVRLTWANPGDATIRKWQVQRREIGSPTGARLGLEAASYRPGGQQAQPAQEGGSYGPWTDIPGSTATTTSYTVTGLVNGKTYGFRIRAVNIAGRPGAPSTEIRVTLRQPPSKPTGVTATPGHGQVTLTWDNPDDATITRWQVQQKEGSGSYGPWRDVPDSTASTTTYTVTGLANGKTYGFKIRAVNAAGPGDPSDEVTATPLHPDTVQADKARRQALAATSPHPSGHGH